MFDIIVVGGGPVGSEVAFKIASNGFSVGVIEQKKDYFSPVCCTGIVSLECVNSFAIDPRLIKRQFSSAIFFSPSGDRLHVERKEPIACVIDRSAFDGFMEERSRRAGAEYLFGYRAESVEIKADHAIIRISRDDTTSTVEGRAVVIASGAASNLLKNSPEYLASDLVMGAQAEVEAPDIAEVEIYTGRDLAPDFFAWLVPAAEGRALAGLLSRKKTGKYLAGFLSKLAHDHRIKTDKVDITYRGINLKTPEKSYGDRLIVVGGAAGQVKPTTGGGIYFSLLSADVAAGVLIDSLRRGNLGEESLSAYEKGWKDRIMPEINSGYHARALYEHLSDGEINTLFQMVASLGIEKYLFSVDNLSFDWHAGIIKAVSDKIFG